MDKVLARLPDQNHNHFRSIAGLPVSPYFSALKLNWLKENIREVRKACREKRCYAGTIDTWLVWNLTGGIDGGAFITDVTNASRTLLMNIETLHWDPLLIKTFSLHVDMLPEIRSSSEIYGRIKSESVLDGIPISAILGNQQASLVGQRCMREGQAKNTYRKGCFLLYNTGTRVSSKCLLKEYQTNHNFQLTSTVCTFHARPGHDGGLPDGTGPTAGVRAGRVRGGGRRRHEVAQGEPGTAEGHSNRFGGGKFCKENVVKK